MIQAILFIITIVLVLVMAVLLSRPAREKIIGTNAFLIQQAARKKANMEHILKMFEKKGEVSNSNIRDALKIDDRTVVRYMDELEKAGKVQQVGKTGQNVVYRIKP